MIKVHYPNRELMDTLKADYKALVNYEEIKTKWTPYKEKYGVELDTLLVGSFEELVDVYLNFISILASQSEEEQKKEKEALSEIFDYNALQPKIAAFFMNANYGWEIKTCHYCDTAYINAYGRTSSYESILEFINNASETDWRRLFSEEQLPDEKIASILENKPFASVDKFNEGHAYLAHRIESYERMKREVDANQFDLDHVLPKGICPIVGWSLFNLVPCCPTCNEKLKGEKELALTKEDWLKLSPTYKGYKWEDDVQIHLVSKDRSSTFFTKNKDSYRLEFETHGDNAYEREISIFRLKDRYNYHKDIALRILDLKERYTKKKIEELSRLLQWGEAQIKEDIFAMDFSKDRCFSKLRKDIMGKE